MDGSEPHIVVSTSSMASAEARDLLHTVMVTDMAEAIEQIGQTLEACNTKKTRLLDRLDEVHRAVEAVRNECGCIDTTIASKVLHLNKLATQIVQQLARVHIPDPPPTPEPLPPPTVEIDLTSVHDRLSGLDHMVADLTKLVLEKEETVLYVVNKRPGNGEITTTAHSQLRSGSLTHDREEEIHDQLTKLQALVRTIQQDQQINGKEEIHRHKKHLNHSRSEQRSNVFSPFEDDDDSSHTNGQRNGNDNDDETSHGSDHTTVGRCALCVQERANEVAAKRANNRRSILSSAYTDRSQSLVTTTAGGGRGLGEALASNGTDIVYYDYEREMICLAGAGDEYSVHFQHGFVVDLYWWALNNEWLILSEQGLYRWKAGESMYHDAYEFSNGEIGFRRIAVTSTSIFCLFRYSLMLLELSNGMQMKRLHALAPPETRYRKLADISVRKMKRTDGNEEDVLGLVWFGSGPGVLIEERFVTPQANNNNERLFRHVPVKEGRFARLASYDDGRAWLISHTGAEVFWIVDNRKITAGQWEATAQWVKVSNGMPINAVGCTGPTVCLRLQDGKLEFLTDDH